MGKIFKSEKRSILVQQVANQIRDVVRSGKLKPGQRLIEKSLSDEMQVSRSAIREAIRYLEKEGLVTTIPYKGAHVTAIGAEDLEEIYTLRAMLEELAVRILIKHLDDEKLASLEAVVEKMRSASDADSLADIIDADLNFHRTICELSGHKRLLESWLQLSNQLRAFVALEDRLYGNDAPDKMFELHYPVYKAIKAKDTRRAVGHIRKLITRGYRNAAAYYGENDKR